MGKLLPAVVVAVLAAAPVHVQEAIPAAGRPNIVFIMSDDHAAHAISAYGSRINQTPHLDRLAREGMLMRNMFVTNSICTPSRAVILTGQYSHLNGVPVFNRFDSSRMTVARLLQQGGYHTGMVGKWHLGSDPVGFDHWEILPGQGAYNDPLLYTATGENRYTGRYVTDVITDLGIEFVKARPRDKPFFLMLHHKAVHSGFTPTEHYRQQFENKWIPEPDTLFDSWATRTDAIYENQQRISQRGTGRGQGAGRRGQAGPAPAAGGARGQGAEPAGAGARSQGAAPAAGGRRGQPGRVGGPPLLVQVPAVLNDDVLRPAYQAFIRDYVATVQSIDDNVGRVLDFLDQEGLGQNTIVIYTSDQGFFLGDHGMFDKRWMYEEALRTPFLVRWPAQIRAGSTSEAMGLNVDFAKTFLDAAGLEPTADMQGRSLLPVLRGQTPADWRTSMYYRYYHDPGHHNTRQHYGVRTMTHKLIYFWTKEQWELYDLVNDPNELHNLYGLPGFEQLTAELKTELARLKREVRDEDQFSVPPPDGGVDGQNPAMLRGQ
jgi:arylsulfatase A-like enzyme